jgi:hypothetical protein
MAQKITFTVASEIVENATSGILLGDFNNWNFEQGIDLQLQKDGSLKATVVLESGTYQYRYFLSDGRWVNDGNADNYVQSEGFFVDNCVITVAAEAPKPAKATKAKVEAVTPVVEAPAEPVIKKVATAKKVTAPAAPVVEEKKATKAKKEVAAPVVVETAPAKPKTTATKTTKAKK